MIQEFTTIMAMNTDSPLLPNTTQNGNQSDEAETPYWDLPTTVILSTLMVIFMIFALVGNFLVIIVVARHRGMRTRTNMFLCNLAIADFLCALLCMPVSLTTMIKGEWIFKQYAWFCQFNGFLMPLFFVTSIHTLMYISVHKYISITRPFSRVITYRRILIMIAMAWLWAAITGYVTIHGLNRVLYKPYTTQCGPDYPKDLRTYMLPAYTTLTCYLIPFTIIIICYVLMFREIRAHGVRLELHSNKEKQAIFIQQRRITFTLFMVLIVFIISWTPYILYSVYVSILKDKSNPPPVINAVSYWFGYMNSACNPIIYALRSPAFRDGYMEILCRTRAVIVSEDLEPVRIGHYIFLRGKTEPWVSSPGPFGKLKSYIKRSTLSHSQRSHDHSTDSQNGGFSSLLSGRHKTLSTNSLPEAVKYRPHANISGAKVTKIGGNQVITIGGKIVYFKEAKRSRDRSKGDSTTSDDQSSSSGPRSIIKKSGVGDTGLRVSFHETTVRGELAPVIENEGMSQENSSATNHVSPCHATENNTIKSNHASTDDSAAETEDDNVFASTGTDPPTTSQFAPRIQITSENNDVFYIENESDTEFLDAKLGPKRPREYTRSVSEQPIVVDDANLNTNANSVPRSTSDNCLNKSNTETSPRRSRVSKTQSFLRWFHRKKTGSPIKGDPPQSPKLPSEKHSSGFLSCPRPGHPRSYSDGEEGDTQLSQGIFSINDNVTKVRSDSQIYSENNCNTKKSWFFKLGNKSAKSDSHMLEERNQERRKVSTTLQNYPSIERLDRIPSRRRKSKRRKQRRLKTKKDISSNTDGSWLEESVVIDVEDSMYSSSGLLNRSLSDPCISIQDMEDKVQFQEDVTRQRSLRRAKKTSSTYSPDVQSIYLILDNFENLRTSEV